MKWKRFISMILITVLIIGVVPAEQLGILVQAADTTSGTIGNVDEFIESSEDQNILIFNSGDQQIKLELCTERTVRIQLSLDGENGYRPEDPEYYMVQKNAWDPVEKTVTDLGDSIQIITAAMEIVVQKEPLRVAMYDQEGNLISKDADDEGIYWDDTGVRGVKKEEGTENAGGIFGFGSGDHGRRANLNRYTSNFSEFSMSHGRVVAPFFMSTVGYGIFLNTIEKDTTFFSKGGGFETQGYLDYFFMYGPDFKTILNEYAEITGRMELYGKWAHGFMLSKYGNDNATQAEFSEWINRLRDEDYPTDCYVFDYGWRGDVADNGTDRGGAGEKWGKQMWNNDTTKFPDIAAMFAEADELGFHVGLHNNAGTPEASGGAELYKEENEEIWVKSYMDSVITTGYGDFFWPDEFDVLGSNTAPTFSSKGAYEAWQEYTDESRPMFMTRGSYAGQHYATAWSGDINPSISELGNQIGFSIDAGLIGYWAVSHDLGGFMSRPSNELYTRWVAEFGAWNGIMRTHGHDGREPWTYDTTAQETLRENLKIRYSLYPYTYSLAWQGYSEGVPMMRAMLLEDGSQYNSDAWNLNKQYYYGDWFLVAPALSTEDTTVSVWLPPQTTWYDYYSGERYEAGEEGRTIQVSAELEEIPVFVKAGAIVPMGPEVDYADELPLNPLTLDIYPAGETSFTLYEDDGESRKYITENAYSTTKFNCVEEGNTITFTINERMDGNPAVYTTDERSYNLKFNYVGSAASVSINGSEIAGVSTVEEYNAMEEAYWLDSGSSTLYVKTEDTGAEKIVTLTNVERNQPELGEEAEAEPATKINSGDVFELEDATYIGGVVLDTEWKGYTGSGFAKGFKNVGDGVEFRVDIQEAGDYNLVLRVNNGKKNSSQYDSSPRQGTMYLDNKVLEEMEFAITDVWGNTVDGVKQGVWVDYTIANVYLEAGVHTFKFLAEGDTNPGNYNLDSLTFNRIDHSVDAFSQIEAETAAVLTNAEVVEDAEASGGQKLVVSQDGAWVQYNELRGEDKGAIKLQVKSSTGGTITVYENGVGDKVLAIVNVPAGDTWSEIWVESKDTDAVTSNIFLQFEAAEGTELNMEVDWLQFETAYPEIWPGDIFELENGWGDTSGNGTLRIDTEWKGYSGTGYLAGWKKLGNYVEFIVNIQESGSYNLVLGTGCGKKNAAQYDSTPRTGALDVNGEQVADFAVEVTETWGDANKNGDWRTTIIENIYLQAGLNTIRIRSAGDVNPGNFNMDYMKFEKNPGKQISVSVNDTAKGSASISDAKEEYEVGSEVTVIAEAAKGYEFVNWTVDGVVVSENAEYTFIVSEDVELVANFAYPLIHSGDIFELENGHGDTSGKGSLRIDTEWKGYSGTGYLAGWKSVGNYVEFTVDIAETADYKLILGTGCGKKNSSKYDSTPRTGAVDVNGEQVADFAVEVTDTWGDSNKNGDWRTCTIMNVHLEAGLNTIRIRSAGDVNPGNFNLDYMKFEKMVELEIVTQPESVTVEKGENAVVHVEAAGEDLTYTWYYKNPGNWKFYKSGDSFVLDDGATYSIPMYAWRDGQEVYCVISDASGDSVQTITVTLTMEKPDIVIVKQPESAVVAKGEDAVVTVEAVGEGLTYTWYYKNSGNVKFYLSGEQFVSEDGTQYIIPMYQWRDGQQVYCVITNAAGDSVQTNTVTLTME